MKTPWLSRLPVQEEGVDINLKDGDAATPLHFAASRGHVDCVSKTIKTIGKNSDAELSFLPLPVLDSHR